MDEKKINTVLYDIDQSSDTSDTQKATARANIGAQAELTAGENITIDPETNTISSSASAVVDVGNSLILDGLGRVAVANSASTASLNSLSTGTSCSATFDSFASGNGTYANTRAIAAGYNTVAWQFSFAIGSNCKAGSNIASSDIAFGSDCNVELGSNSIVGGHDSSCTGDSCAVFGAENSATSYCCLISGTGNTCKNPNSAAIGHGLNVQTASLVDGQIVVGQYNATDERQKFIVGDGDYDDGRHNSFTVGRNLYDQREVRVNANLVLPTSNWPDKNVNNTLYYLGHIAGAETGSNVLAPIPGTGEYTIFDMSNVKYWMDYYWLEHAYLRGYIQLNFSNAVSVSSATTMLQTTLHNSNGSTSKYLETYKIYNSVQAGQVITWPVNMPVEYSWAVDNAVYKIEFINSNILGSTLSWDIKIVCGW